MNEQFLDERHDCRYFIQYVFIPNLVESVNDGYLPPISLFKSPQWNMNIREEFDLELAEMDKITSEKIDIDERHMMILYTFPEPEYMIEAAYGTVILNTETNQAKYYTLESGYDGCWVYGHKTLHGHSSHGFVDSPDLEAFKKWAIKQALD